MKFFMVSFVLRKILLRKDSTWKKKLLSCLLNELGKFSKGKFMSMILLEVFRLKNFFWDEFYILLMRHQENVNKWLKEIH